MNLCVLGAFFPARAPEKTGLSAPIFAPGGKNSASIGRAGDNRHVQTASYPPASPCVLKNGFHAGRL
jgi:hypothetical protein